MEPAADGLLHLEFAGQEGKQATLSAIEILPGFRGHIRPVRLLARQTPYYSNDSHWWSPDDYFQGGQLAAYATPVTGTDDPELYETERWGNFSYAIPVTPGRYTLVLHFAARHGAWDQSASASIENRAAVAHLFDVYCNGRALLLNFNLAQEAHQADVVTRKFRGSRRQCPGEVAAELCAGGGLCDRDRHRGSSRISAPAGARTQSIPWKQIRRERVLGIGAGRWRSSPRPDCKGETHAVICRSCQSGYPDWICGSSTVMPASSSQSPKSGHGTIVIVFKDGHRQSYNLPILSGSSFPKRGVAADREGARESVCAVAWPLSGQVGGWRRDGKHFHITLEDNGDAWRSWPCTWPLGLRGRRGAHQLGRRLAGCDPQGWHLLPEVRLQSGQIRHRYAG